jgi:hypothetical protein
MAFNYGNKIDGIVDVLMAHNTVTASPFLSESLTTTIPKHMVLNDDPASRGLRNDEYPCVFVRLATAEEDFGGIGGTGSAGAHKTKSLTFDVLGFYRREGVEQTNEQTMNECYKLAENIEAVLRAEYTASGTALWIQPRSVDFLGPFNDGTSWIKVVQMQVEGKYHFR